MSLKKSYPRCQGLELISDDCLQGMAGSHFENEEKKGFYAPFRTILQI
jgi:hypothetical protein